ncbi:P-loop containing nucleoside triphosphate hydrolase,Small GTP-binding protein domain,Small GTPase [Cinara cedri]|uniref:P-loop containing nucleoside triphosphate hydrolase,Small GTP-binding protein domain,Small GTPase n=1 Tax=Cinara cedri TaxID=506608 RepID=A0A5E4MWN1_9HEMI|nr:P-loop containing nucleoside triphosphate hydrolase,Small GTP-binding protein domain,Small GTPase [Cinara cedri]
MGNNVLRFKCLDCANADQRQRRKITLLLVGLDNAGKTCTVKSIMKEKQKNILPTVGFSSSKFNYRENAITIYDLGGHKQIRDIWKQYFADVHGVIFVVDSTDHRRLDECKEVFENLLGNENIAGKPVLLFANKQDKQGALDELDIVDRLNVEAVVNTNKCPTLVETCTALHMAPINYCSSAFIDPSIDSGFNWLVSQIVKLYDTLNRRVIEDMAQYKADVDKRMEEWKKKKQTSNDSYLLSFNAPHRRSDRRNPFRRINKVIDSFESKTSNPITEMGSTSYIIPLRSESDEDYDRESIPQLAPIIFKNKVAPTIPTEMQIEPMQSQINTSRSPLFRAKSREYDKSLPETETISAIPSTELFIQNDPGTAKLKRSIFRNKSNSAGASSNSTTGRPSKPNRSTSAKIFKKSSLFSGSTDKEENHRRLHKSNPDDESLVIQQPDTTVSPELISHM